MTGLSGRGNDGEAELVLVCDGCGQATHAAGMQVRDFRLVWVAAERIGWKGLDRPLGPHFCPACAAGSPRRHGRRGRPIH